VRNGLASLKGARLVIVDENDGEDSGFLSTPLLKQVISGEKVEARFLYREHFEFEVTFKILIATNYLPAFKIFDDALKRRIIVIPFVNKVSPEHYDPTLGERLEEELPGILNWALEGVELLKKYGLHLPFLLQKELHEYSLNFNSIRRFLEAACIEDHSSQMASNDLYQLYCLYCKAYGEGRPMKHKSFSMRIKEAGYSKSRRKDGVFFMGIRQKDKYHLASEWGLSIENFQ
jgi:putative DNA primase/helicase